MALVALALMLFLYFTAEVFTAGALLPMHRDFGVPVSEIGTLVTFYAVVSGAAILPMTALTLRIPPRLLLTVAMGLLALTQLGIALAPTLTWVIVLRGVSALFHGAVWASAPSTAAALLPGRPGRATASVFIGSALGNVIGAPFVAAVSAIASWRAAAVTLAVLSLACAAGLAATLPRSAGAARGAGMPRGDGVTRHRRSTSQGGVEPRPDSAEILRVARWCVLVVLVASAHLASFTFIAELAARARITGGGLPLLLLVAGASGLAGTLVMARASDQRPRASMLSALMLMAFSLLTIAVGVPPGILVVAVAAWVAAYSALTVALQAMVLRDAPSWARMASSWYVLFFQVGIATGSGLGAGLLSLTGAPTSLALVSGMIAAAVLVLAVFMMRRDTAARASSTGSGSDSSGVH